MGGAPPPNLELSSVCLGGHPLVAIPPFASCRGEPHCCPYGRPGAFSSLPDCTAPGQSCGPQWRGEVGSHSLPNAGREPRSLFPQAEAGPRLPPPLVRAAWCQKSAFGQTEAEDGGVSCWESQRQRSGPDPGVPGDYWCPFPQHPLGPPLWPVAALGALERAEDRPGALAPRQGKLLQTGWSVASSRDRP